jgi:hypothetical protein
MNFFYSIIFLTIHQIHSQDLETTETTTKLVKITKKAEIKKKNETTLLFCVKGFENEICLADGFGNKRSIDEVSITFFDYLF